MLRGELPPVSNRESFIDEITLVDPDTNTLWDLTGVTGKVQLEQTNVLFTQPDYAPWISYGAWSYPPITLLATTENGALVNIGDALQFTFTLAQMQSLPSGQYRLSASITRNDETLQLFQYDMSILYGGLPT